MSDTDRADIAVVGGGAAGLAAAIFAAEAARDAGVGLDIRILDGAPRIGAKILVSGGGRCNVTHDAVTPDDFHGSGPVIRNILRHFDEQAAVGWFESMGVPLKREETGKLFPVSDSARTVVDALLQRCSELGVGVHTGHRVAEIVRDGEGFVIHASSGAVTARRVIMATGGRSLPRTGSDGTGWRIVRTLGHTVTATHPALVPLVLDPAFFHASLSGLAQEVTLSTFVDGRQIDRRTGSLLWTHFGVSGPVVMDASRFWVIARAQGRGAELRCAMLPWTFDQTQQRLINAAGRHQRRPVASVLADRLPRRVAEALASHLGLEATTMGQLQREARRALVHTLTGLVLPVQAERGWNYAEVTAGGVPLCEVDHRTMQSRVTPGLHLVGELLDCDGRIGGFNFQWAWSTGHIAGRAAVAALAPSAADSVP
jgi:predicted Rossmann fold flavoprotein